MGIFDSIAVENVEYLITWQSQMGIFGSMAILNGTYLILY